MSDPVILMTSISPSHANEKAQGIAVDSWVAHGITPLSFNSPAEIAVLAPQYPAVRFVECRRTGQSIYKAPYTLVNAFIDHAKEQRYEYAMIVNSDIAIADPQNVLGNYIERSASGLLFANRYDHNGDNQNPTQYDFGFDAFIIHRTHFDILPQSLFAMGQTWWDYWIPYRFIKSGVPITLMKEPIFLHHRHAVQYHQKEWERMTEHFVWVEDYTRPANYRSTTSGRIAQHITNEVYRLIRKHAR